MFSKFFIDRPVFASVLSILIVLAGLVCMSALPISRFPNIVPPQVQINATYQGADAETVASAVAAPIEQQLSGAKGLIYYQSQSGNDGSLKLTCTFDIGTDQDIAAVDVQNRLSTAQPQLPTSVIEQGITITKTSTQMLCVVSMESDAAQYNDLYLSNYATIYMKDALARIYGVGMVNVFGAGNYSMRVWLNPDRLAQKQITVTDVASAINEQNQVFAAGRIGQRPNTEPVQLTMPVLTKGRLDEPALYDNIILRANPDGSMIKIKDVGYSELGAQSYDVIGRNNGNPAALIIIYLQVGANALDTMNHVEATLKEQSSSFPSGVRYVVSFDSTDFVRVSIGEVIKTLIEAIIIVLLVVFIFLQNWRATLIPLMAVPVALIGTFVGMAGLGFSINTLTLFGLVLAIGLVVDDAIVVVENIERIIEQEHLPVREASIKAMEQVTGPVVAVVLVLSAVFLPVAFLGGLTGQFYKQFAVTIAISMAISGLIALTLSPAMSRLLLKPSHGKKKMILFRWFNTWFDKVTSGYTHGVRLSIKAGIITMILFAALIAVTWKLFDNVPMGFVPDEDQGYVMTSIILPDGASLDRTDDVTKKVEQYFASRKDVTLHCIVLGGFDKLGGGVNSTNSCTVITRLKDWKLRNKPGLGALDIVAQANREFSNIKEATVFAFNPPAIQGLGMRAGFEVNVEARGNNDLGQLGVTMNKFMEKLHERREISRANSTLRLTVPTLFVDLDREKSKMMGLQINDIFRSLQAYLGGLYINQFDKYGRVWQVNIQAMPEYRKTPDDLLQIYVRNAAGDMTPLSEVIKTNYKVGPNILYRFNGFNAFQVTGAPSPGYSVGQSMQAVREVAAETLPEGFGFDWSSASYFQEQTGSASVVAIVFGLIVVFLVLAAQYESWSLPSAVMMAVPFGIFGALLSVYLRHLDNDIYFQIGLLTLVGLAAKNAILIVEFCVELRQQGKSLFDSAVEGARLRFRPILMTSLAFILGAMPLATASGAGAASRHAIGTGVVGGMITATFLAIFFVPLFFVLVRKLGEAFGTKEQETKDVAQEAE
ncbi:MAG: multidrug efflux RND transporter permease subunit [bacterium]